MKRGRKTQTEIIVSVLLIIVVIAAVAIIGTFINNSIKQDIKKSELLSKTSDIYISKAEIIGGAEVEVTIARGSNTEPLKGIRLVLSNNAGQTQTYEDTTTTFTAFEEKKITVFLTISPPIIGIDLYPLFSLDGTNLQIGSKAGYTSAISEKTRPINSTSGYLGMSFPADFVAFSSDSPWNTLIPASPEIDANSTIMIAKLASNVSSLRKNYLSWTSPVHVINYYETRKVNVTTTSADNLNIEIDPNQDKIIENLPIPSQVWQDAQTDGHVVIIDPNLRISWEFSRFKVIDAQQGIYNASMIHRWDLNSKGYISPFNGTTWWTQGAVGSGEPIISGLVRIEEIKAGIINHALRFATPINRKNTTLGRWELVSPACRTDGKYTGIEYIPEGARLQLNPNLNLDLLNITNETKIIARALQKYGMINGDNSGTFNIYFQNLNSSGGEWNNYNFELSKINISEFRVLKMNITAKI